MFQFNSLLTTEPPSIYLSQPVTYTVPGDDDTTIFCTGTGKPQPSVTFGEQKCSGQSQGNAMHHFSSDPASNQWSTKCHLLMSSIQ